MNPFSSNSNPEKSGQVAYGRLLVAWNAFAKIAMARPDVLQPEVVSTKTAQAQPQAETTPPADNLVDLDKYRQQRAQNGAVAVDGVVASELADQGQQQLAEDARNKLADIRGELAA